MIKIRLIWKRYTLQQLKQMGLAKFSYEFSKFQRKYDKYYKKYVLQMNLNHLILKELDRMDKQLYIYYEAEKYHKELK